MFLYRSLVRFNKSVLVLRTIMLAHLMRASAMVIKKQRLKVRTQSIIIITRLKQKIHFACIAHHLSECIQLYVLPLVERTSVSIQVQCTRGNFGGKPCRIMHQTNTRPQEKPIRHSSSPPVHSEARCTNKTMKKHAVQRNKTSLFLFRGCTSRIRTEA